ncbi:MAG: hypothetical protein HY698_17525 [Deltaproteobacteria bacterium]|nr:hypothetical protein [Deltaproteobacteria bacterium]
MKRPVAWGAVLLLSLAACASLLGIHPRERRSFEHRPHVLKGVQCLRCHEGIPSAGDEGPLHLPGTAECLECHEKPHDQRECGSCHGLPERRDGAVLARKHLRFSHQKHVARFKGNCMRCHVDVARDGEQLRPRMATCTSCHPHVAQNDIGDCNACHVDLPSEGTKPASHIVHGPDFVREHGTRASSQGTCASCHAQKFCASCHGVTVPALTEKVMFDETNKVGVHRAGFRSRHAEEARGQPGLCTTCHSENTCTSCHVEKGVAAPREGIGSPHPIGWVGLQGEPNEHGPASRRNPLECATCHGGAGEMLCVGCHRVGAMGGTVHPPGWTSRLGAKTDMPCRLCHEDAP